MLKGAKRRSKDRYCSFDKDHGHDTEECRDLMADIECLVQDGTLKKYQSRGGQTGQKRDKRKQSQSHGTCAPSTEEKVRKDFDEGDDEPQYAGEINTIIGVQPGTTRSSLKAEAQSPQSCDPSHKRLKKDEAITFSDDDHVPATTPHNDAIVIQVGVENQLEHRVYIDTGASVSILFKDCFDRMHLGEARLAPASLPLKSFAQDETKPEGIISLHVTAGKPPKSSTHVAQFFVVKTGAGLAECSQGSLLDLPLDDQIPYTRGSGIRPRRPEEG